MVPVLYFSLELGSKNWKLAFTIGLGQKPRLRTIAARDTDALLGMDGFILWLEWSAQSEKLDQQTCYRNWTSIDPAGACGLRSLFWRAGQADCDRAARAKAISRRVRQTEQRARIKDAIDRRRHRAGGPADEDSAPTPAC
jgi:hypothetical protein